MEVEMELISKIYKTTNGGDTWEYSEIDIGNEELGISMIHALDAQLLGCSLS